MIKVITGLDRLVEDKSLQKKCNGNIAYLCHNASIDHKYREGLSLLNSAFGDRLKRIFSPQHGLFSEAQDNMIESDHFVHPYYKIPVHSLYSETRTPTDAMLEGIDHVLIDLQDVGCRAYTFIYTMILMMEACGKKGIDVVVLDRPNPLNGMDVEGNVLESDFTSFIGLHPLPMRHGLTIGEIAKMAVKYWQISCSLDVIPMQGWQREMYFEDTGLPWVFPSPNIPTLKTVKVFPGMVLWEGTNLSEGRGTTCPFELFGHPKIDPHKWLPELDKAIKKSRIEGFILRPIFFQPTFEKHAGATCGGFHLHVTNKRSFRPWRTGQVLMRELYRLMGDDFQWRQPPFEYEEKLLPVDMLNGSDRLRRWVEEQADDQELDALEKTQSDFYKCRNENLIY